MLSREIVRYIYDLEEKGFDETCLGMWDREGVDDKNYSTNCLISSLYNSPKIK